MSVRFTGEMMELNHLRGAPNTDIEVLGFTASRGCKEIQTL
jgi:hypothetical protein